jgi:hypothetical protein
MTDTYTITDAPRAAGNRMGIIRPLLWLALTISAVCNIVTSSMDVNILVGIGFGLLTLAFGAALFADHRRNRRH